MVSVRVMCRLWWNSSEVGVSCWCRCLKVFFRLCGEWLSRVLFCLLVMVFGLFVLVSLWFSVVRLVVRVLSECSRFF